jgi:hypothetical protein
MKKLLISILTLMLLAGCASIPNAGPIQIINEKDSQAGFNDVRVIAKPPTTRMNAVQIASGFVAANISTFGDFSVARKYMNSAASRSWYPKNFDVLDSASIQYNDLGTGVVEVSALQIGKLRANHRFDIFPVAKPYLLKMYIKKGANGLRISNTIPNGILSSSDMVRGFSAYNIYFGNESFTKLVPEIVWFPKNEKSLATKLTNELISNSRESLKTAIPNGTKLRSGSVMVSTGTAFVNLNASALIADSEQREFMIAQFVWTLQEITEVGRVQIATNDRVLSTRGKAFLNRSDFANIDPDYSKLSSALFLLEKSYLSSLHEGLLSDLGRLKGNAKFTVSNNHRTIAYVSSGKLRVASILKLKKSKVLAPNAVSLSFDQLGRLWFTDASGNLFCLPPDETIQQLALPVDMKVNDFSLSSDGGRIALVVSNNKGSRLLVGSLVSENGVIAFERLRRVEQTLSEVFQVDWIDSRELVVIGKIGLSESVTAMVSLTNGSLRNLNAPRIFESISASNENTVVAITKSKSAWIYEDGLWTKFDTNTHAQYSE